MSRYRKLIIAAIGLGLLALRDLANVDLPFLPESVYTVALTILTAFGVYKVPNDS